MPFSPCTVKTGTVDLSTGNPAASLCGVTSWYQKESGVTWLQFPAGQNQVRIQIDVAAPVTLQYDFYTRPTTVEHCYTWTAGTKFDAEFTAVNGQTSFGLGFYQGGTNPSSWLHGAAVTTSFANTPTQTPCTPLPYCQYGTELSEPGQYMYYLTPALIDTVLVAAGVPELAPFFTAFWFITYDARTVCAGLPPPPPEVTLQTFDWSPAALMRLWQSVGFWYFCKCTSGPTTPVAPPKPVIPTPPGMPQPVTFSCDPANLCAAILTLQRMVAALQEQVGDIKTTTALLQRYGLPFGTIAGATHSALPASGTFAVSRLVGMRAELLSPPPSRVLEGQPPYLWDLGWMSFSDQAGMLQQQRITRTTMDWLPPAAQLATVFGWYMKPGATLRFTELQAEP